VIPSWTEISASTIHVHSFPRKYAGMKVVSATPDNITEAVEAFRQVAASRILTLTLIQ